MPKAASSNVSSQEVDLRTEQDKLQEQIESLQKTITSLQNSVTSQEKKIDLLEAQLSDISLSSLEETEWEPALPQRTWESAFTAAVAELFSKTNVSIINNDRLVTMHLSKGLRIADMAKKAAISYLQHQELSKKEKVEDPLKNLINNEKEPHQE